jgi:Kelch motif protein
VRALRRILKIVVLVLLILIVVGGAFIGNILTSNPYPRPEADGWARLKDIPHPRGEVGATTVVPGPAGTQDICPEGPCSPQFFVVGGLAGVLGKTTGQVDILDAGTGKWRTGPKLPEPRHHPAAASIDGAVYVTGGSRKAAKWKPESNLWVLRPGEDTWDRLPDMPEGRMAHAMVASNGKLYVIGGRGETTRVLIYDRTTGWTAGAAMPNRRDHLGAVFVQGKIYAIGGRRSAIMRNVDIYDIATDTWSQGPALPYATSGMAAELLSDGRIHVIGGENPKTFGGGVVDRHQILDLASGTWATGPKPLLTVHGAASDEIAGVLLVVGGARRQGTYSVLAWTGVTQRFDPKEAPRPLPTSSGSPAPTESLPGE